MQRRVPAHRMADDVRFIDSQRIKEGNDIVARNLLTVMRGIFGHVRRRIAALTKSDASMRAREMPELRFPCPVAAAKLVDENDAASRPDLLILEPGAAKRLEQEHT